MKKVAIIGLGYVGLPLALLTAKKKYDTIGIDLDKAKVDTIKAGKDPLGDEYIARSATFASTAGGRVQRSFPGSTLGKRRRVVAKVLIALCVRDRPGFLNATPFIVLFAKLAMRRGN